MSIFRLNYSFIVYIILVIFIFFIVILILINDIPPIFMNTPLVWQIKLKIKFVNYCKIKLGNDKK